MATILAATKGRHSSSDVRTPSSEARPSSQLDTNTRVEELHKVKNFCFSASTCLDLVDKLSDNHIEHEFKKIEHLFSGRKTKKAKRGFIRAACSDSSIDFLTGFETEMKNVNSLLTQLNDRLHAVENFSSIFEDVTSKLGIMRSEKDPVIYSDNNLPDKNTDVKHSSTIHVPPASLPNSLLLSDELVEVNQPILT